mmetsp:Transcript_26183/g.61405  ORF Transcript_26183/g.61405 Transcript_26183/m.61405 type:complete len:204 (-) Transcript_26183:675-1286(-)
MLPICPNLHLAGSWSSCNCRHSKQKPLPQPAGGAQSTWLQPIVLVMAWPQLGHCFVSPNSASHLRVLEEGGHSLPVCFSLPHAMQYTSPHSFPGHATSPLPTSSGITTPTAPHPHRSTAFAPDLNAICSFFSSCRSSISSRSQLESTDLTMLVAKRLGQDGHLTASAPAPDEPATVTVMYCRAHDRQKKCISSSFSQATLSFG